MADYCKDCAEKHGFPEFDIDVLQEAQAMEAGEYVSVLCEGCSLMRIEKDQDGNILVGYALDDGNWDDPLKMIKWEDRHNRTKG